MGNNRSLAKAKVLNRHFSEAVLLLFAFMICFSKPAFSRDINTVTFDLPTLLSNLKRSDFSDYSKAYPLLMERTTRARALDDLASTLANSDEGTRSRIVRLLEEVGVRSTAKPYHRLGFIQDPLIIKILMTAGLAKQDTASTEAENVILDYCTPADIARHRRLILEKMKGLDTSFVMLSAKGKVLEAIPYLLAMEQKLGPDHFLAEKLSIAKAALGDEKEEHAWLTRLFQADRNAPPAPRNSFYDVGPAKDGMEVARLLRTIYQIGTRSTLKAICHFVRSPLKNYHVDNSEESVRYIAVGALSYTFPDEKALRRPTSDEDWRGVEKFCVEKLGAKFDGPTPPSPVEYPYPRF